MNVLGIWDGHDSGAALLVDGRLVAAVNEERLTRRKLEVGFPARSIACCLELAGLRPAEVQRVAASTADPAKTLTRLVPSLGDSYYRLRRRQVAPGPLARWKKGAKYRITEWGPNRLSRALSLRSLRASIASCGLGGAELRLFDHHRSHAIAAALGSGSEAAVVITLDGVGDGAAATVSRWREGRLEELARTPARDSLGIFFEHVTNLLNLRELEDEGKVMALADYTLAVPDEENPLLGLVRVDGLRLRCAAPGHALYRRLAAIHYRHSNERFARLAQRVVEKVTVELAANAVAATGIGRVAFSGGVVSNIKATQAVRSLPGVEEVSVFPHMGDGGLALGAALLAAAESGDSPRLDLADLGLGPGIGDEECAAALARAGLEGRRVDDRAAVVAEIVAAGRVAMWVQGRMEYGPRALGRRSVVARPDLPELRQRLNLVLKRRSWYQPFCPSMLESDARRLLADLAGPPNRHMTIAYDVSEAGLGALAGVVGLDGSCRPQIVPDDEVTPWAELLRAVRGHTGVGAVLNTSLNLHGEPLVCTADEAIDVYRRSDADALCLGPFLVEREPGGGAS